jgi:hypothetical protein
MSAVGQSSFVKTLHRESGKQRHPPPSGYAERQQMNPPPDHWGLL